jgi:hypothetical protein
MNKKTLSMLCMIKICGYFWKVRQPTEGKIKENYSFPPSWEKKYKVAFLRVFLDQFENCVKLTVKRKSSYTAKIVW